MDIRPRARHLAVIVSAAVLGLFVTPAPAGAGGVSGLVEGPAHPVGAGNARTYVTVDEAGTPATIGVRLDAAALDDLPGALLPVTEAYVLELPEEAAATAFDHVTVDWNSHGHDPQHGFDVPHFDVHFYLLDRPTVESIHPFAPGYIPAAARVPDPRYVPEGYAPSGDPLTSTVAGMGLHWVDTTEAEHDPAAGHHLTETVLYGTWDGRQAFIEPMLSREWLATRPAHHEELRLPEAYHREGLYPTTYSVWWDEASQTYTVELGGLTMREAS
ncbi:DUF5602 domain-containing protein [Rhodococcus sp. Chr-9]|uniref:DUF5602 domain-containing protein n=1 Tax=Rhodococcus sp. Chr-9 TaxID=713612 RepID=UPI00057389DA|nr:DUF5602 domain-containing protein [Rhodococcus sp. Chr-9]KHJ74224.1 hypothetical protein QR64_02715 [Rhodococcus sp. Chr-9]